MDIEVELRRAREALRAGSAGRARVCARRAAGAAARAWYERRGLGVAGDALKQLKRLGADPAVPAGMRAAAERLTTKVDADHRLPFDADPVEDAEAIIRFANE